MYVEDVEDRSNTPKAVMLCMSKMSKMSKIDQIHLRAVMLCMLKMSKMGKEHTHTFWLITSLILNGFSIRKKFWKTETESFPTIPSNSMYAKACQRCQRWEKNIQTHFYHIFLNMVSFECNPMYVEDVEDRSNTPKGCNAMYVEDVEDGKRTYTHMGKELRHLRYASTYKGFDGMVGKLSVSAFTYPVLCSNYNVDCNSMSSNYSKIRFKPLIYFEIKQSSN